MRPTGAPLFGSFVQVNETASVGCHFAIGLNVIRILEKTFLEVVDTMELLLIRIRVQAGAFFIAIC